MKGREERVRRKGEEGREGKGSKEREEGKRKREGRGKEASIRYFGWEGITEACADSGQTHRSRPTTSENTTCEHSMLVMIS